MIVIRFIDRAPSPWNVAIGMETDSNVEQLKFILPDLAEGKTAYVNIILPDQTADVLPIGDDGVVTIPATLTAVPGQAEAWVEIIADGDVIWHSEKMFLNIGDLPPIGEMLARQYPTALQQAMAATGKHVNESKKYAERAEEAANTAQASADLAQAAVGKAEALSESVAETIRTATDDAVRRAGEAAERAESAVENMDGVAESAREDALAAENAAAQAKKYATLAQMDAATHGLFNVYINDAGRLIYERTDTIGDVNLLLDNGRLIIEYPLEGVVYHGD